MDELDIDMQSLVDVGLIDDQSNPTDDNANHDDLHDSAEESVVVDNPNENFGNSPSNAALSAFTKLLADEGVVSLNEDSKIESPEDLIEIIRNTIKENELSHLSEDQKQALKAFEAGVSIEDYIQSQKKVRTIAEIKNEQIESDSELRRDIIKQWYIEKGFSDEKADRLTQDSFDLGRDIEDALEAKNDRLKIEEQRIAKLIAQQEQEKVEAEKRQSAELKKLKDKVYKEEEVIQGIPFNKKTAEKVYESMTKIVGEHNGQPINQLMKDRLENPIEFEHKLHYVYTITNGFKDFSKLLKTSKSKAISDFEKALNSTNQTYQSSTMNLGNNSILDSILENPNIK